MLLSFDKRFLFVANTKSASTSIEAVLRPHAQIVRLESSARKHVPLAQALEEYAPDFDAAGCAPRQVLKFGVMRDPIDWIGSWFRYRKGNKTTSPLPEGMTFPEFWVRADWNIRRQTGQKHLQRRMFCTRGRPIADIVIPFPRITAIFGQICAGLDLPLDNLPRENASRLTRIEGMTPALEDEMRAFYADDYMLYDRLDALNAPALARLAEGYYRAA